MSLDVFGKWLKTQLFELRSGGHSTSWGTVHEKVSESDLVPLWDGTTRRRSLQNASFWRAHNFELESLGILGAAPVVVL